MVEHTESSETTPKTQTEHSGGGSGGGKKITAVGTGDDGDFNDWLRKLAEIFSSPAPTKLTNPPFHRNRLLQEIALLPGVIGSLIVAPDGTLVASTFPKWYDSPSIAVSALGIFMSSEHVIMKLGHDRLMLISLKSTATNTLIAELSPGLDAGLLVIVTADNHDLPWLEPLRLLFARVTA